MNRQAHQFVGFIENRKAVNRKEYTDVKTKIVNLSSNPKAYNIDKFLKCMAEDNSVVLFFFIGIDEHGIVNVALSSVFHKTLVESMLLQPHWAGRARRGVAQFSGKAIDGILGQQDFKNVIDKAECREFLLSLIDR